jgi:hypothetical protein
VPSSARPLEVLGRSILEAFRTKVTCLQSIALREFSCPWGNYGNPVVAKNRRREAATEKGPASGIANCQFWATPGETLDIV